MLGFSIAKNIGTENISGQKLIIFTYYEGYTRAITNLFKHTNRNSFSKMDKCNWAIVKNENAKTD
jgi:hypothetical protein